MTTPLFTPFTLNSLQLANRVVMAPMTRAQSKNHIPGEDVAQYYKRRAEGGVGLIITEGTTPGHKAGVGTADVPDFYGEKALKGWKHVVDEVHKVGGKIFPQIWHVGSVRQSNVCNNSECDCEKNVPGYGPSAIAHPYIPNGEIPHEMTKQDIDEVIGAFAQAALDAKNLGFDGVEIHGAHGYLADQFFWDVTNKREDEYGGKTLAERTRFAVELVRAMREKVGADFPICFRFSQWKLGDYKAKLAHTPEELATLLIPLSEAGVDIFHCSSRRFWEPEFPGSPLNLAGWTKKITGKATITVGSVGLDVDFISNMVKGKTDIKNSQAQWPQLLESLKNEEYDLVAVGRAVLADPKWANKIKENRTEEITIYTQNSLMTLS